jgi:hypothetical protein
MKSMRRRIIHNLLKTDTTFAQIRAAEDILALTRTMKEAWLFGQLDTLGENERDIERREKLEADVQAVKKAIDGGLLMPKDK